jgi:hypothetical protein
MLHWLFMHFKKACVSVRSEVLYNILIKFGIPMKLFRLVKMCLSETYVKYVWVSNAFPIQNGLKERAAFSPVAFKFSLECYTGKVKGN